MHYGLFVFGLLAALAGPAVAEDVTLVAPSIDQVVPSQKNRSILPPVVREKYEYYEIKGSREEDLQCELKAKGCDWIDGKTYDSMTTWRFKWDYDHVRSPGSCAVDAFRVSVDITFRYPKWMKDETAPQALIEKWNVYMQGLVDHENGHRDMAIHTANALVVAVNALSPASDCDDLDRSIRQVCRLHIDQLQEDTEAYDAGTVHGGSQGAILE